MKSLILVLALLPLSSIAEETLSKEAKNRTESISTEHSFEDLLVQGQYHFSDQSVMTVDEDKVLNALIGVRQDFKDRIENSIYRN